MNKSFKINICFDEECENLENLIEHLIINMLEKKVYKNCKINWIFLIAWEYKFNSIFNIILEN